VLLPDCPRHLDEDFVSPTAVRYFCFRSSDGAIVLDLLAHFLDHLIALPSRHPIKRPVDALFGYPQIVLKAGGR
jgi:hypothetical protein